MTSLYGAQDVAARGKGVRVQGWSMAVQACYMSCITQKMPALWPFLIFPYATDFC
jgi:hypothetical protein